MSNLSDNPTRRSLLLFGLLCLTIAGFGLWGGMRRNGQLAKLEDIYQRMTWAQSGPLPSDTQTLAYLQQSIAALEEGLALDERDLFRGHLGSLSTEVAGNPTAAFFELAGFIESAYAKLKANGIGFDPVDRFGFSQFTRQGPETKILDAVMEQKIVAEYLMDQLIAAKPARLTGMKREWIVPASEHSQPALRQAVGNPNPPPMPFADTFAPRENRPGYVSYAFEVGFEGYSEALRNFLTSLMAAPVPILVIDLRVEPLDRYTEPDSPAQETISQNPFDLLSTAASNPPEEKPVPIIQSNLSSFTVILETILRKEPQLQ